MNLAITNYPSNHIWSTTRLLVAIFLININYLNQSISLMSISTLTFPILLITVILLIPTVFIVAEYWKAINKNSVRLLSILSILIGYISFLLHINEVCNDYKKGFFIFGLTAFCLIGIIILIIPLFEDDTRSYLEKLIDWLRFLYFLVLVCGLTMFIFKGVFYDFISDLNSKEIRVIGEFYNEDSSNFIKDTCTVLLTFDGEEFPYKIKTTNGKINHKLKIKERLIGLKPNILGYCAGCNNSKYLRDKRIFSDTLNLTALLLECQ